MKKMITIATKDSHKWLSTEPKNGSFQKRPRLILLGSNNDLLDDYSNSSITLAGTPFITGNVSQHYAAKRTAKESDLINSLEEVFGYTYSIYDLQNTITYSGAQVTDLPYYFHRDHLGSAALVTDSVGNVDHRMEYTPDGSLFFQTVTGNYRTPYRFNAKEYDDDTELYYFVARYYDKNLGIWISPDPMAEDYPGVSPYAYCAGNPVNRIDPDGKDWYKDIDGTYQYNPNVSSQKDLGRGQLYKGKIIRENGTYYRKDGSILYNNETKAYNRMWNQADKHYRTPKEKAGREVGGFILSDGKVLVLPDYLNDARTTEISKYGYKVTKDGKLIKGNESLNIIAQIHTHQVKSSNPDLSVYPRYDSDFALSKNTNGLIVFAISHNNKVYGGFVNHNQKFEVFEPFNRSELLHGRILLYPSLRKISSK